MLWDVFISHASEDKASIARPLAAALESAGLRVWLDEAQLRIGDSLRQKLDEGLAQSRFGVVILSRAFFDKQWPQRELGALYARPDAVLPVWHEMDASEVAAVSPLLADVVAASTSDGIGTVAEKILQVAGTHLPRSRRDRQPYTSRLSVRTDRVRRALEVIESLATPATWAQLDFTAPDYPRSGWMGTESSALIEILHGFAAPLIEYRQLAYSVRRNRALLDGRTRLQFALLEAATETFLNEGEIAAEAPAIPYTPRAPGWRSKRITDPTRYWWQGVSPERLDAAVPFFLRPKDAGAAADPLLTAQEFSDVYRHAFASGDEKVQQAIGLLANGFYGFRPATRPVLWRVCVCIARIFQAILGNSRFDPDATDLGGLEELYSPRETDCFPFEPLDLPNDLYEPYPQTLAVTLSYLNASTLRRIRASLAAPREDAPLA